MHRARHVWRRILVASAGLASGAAGVPRPASTSCTSAWSSPTGAARRSSGSTPTTSRSSRQGKPQKIKFFAGGEPGERPAAAPRVHDRQQRQHDPGHQGRADRRDQVPQRASRTSSTSRSPTSTPRSGSRGSAPTTSPADRTHPRAQAGRLHRALRRARRLPRRRVDADRRQDPRALHRRRRHAQRDHARGSCSTCSRRRT